MFLLVFAPGVCLSISKCILFTYAKNFQDSLKPRMKVFPSRKHLCLLLPKTLASHQVLRSSSQLKVDKVRLSEVKVAQSCSTLCDPTDYTVHGILQARILEWVAISFSRGSFQPRDRTRVALNVGGFFTSWATREAQVRLPCMYLYIWEIYHKLHNRYGPSEDILTLIQHNIFII